MLHFIAVWCLLIITCTFISQSRTIRIGSGSSSISWSGPPVWTHFKEAAYPTQCHCPFARNPPFYEVASKKNENQKWPQKIRANVGKCPPDGDVFTCLAAAVFAQVAFGLYLITLPLCLNLIHVYMVSYLSQSSHLNIIILCLRRNDTLHWLSQGKVGSVIVAKSMSPYCQSLHPTSTHFLPFSFHNQYKASLRQLEVIYYCLSLSFMSSQ